jgi:hypothetical protein
MPVEQRYAAFERAKEYTKLYTLEANDEFIVKQEDGYLGYASAGQLATTGSNIFTGGQIIMGNITIAGDIFANEFLVTTSSTEHFTASTNFGLDGGDAHTFTGSVRITGSLNVIGGINGQINATNGVISSSAQIAAQLGWGRYDDTQYTTSSFYTLLPASGAVTLPNNGGNTIEPYTNISFYDTGSQRIQVENINDVYMCTVTFKAKTANANSAYMRVQMDSVGPTAYERVGKDLFFGKGNEIWHTFHDVFQYYADSDFVTYGNRWKIQAFDASVNISNVIFFIQRTHNTSI